VTPQTVTPQTVTPQTVTPQIVTPQTMKPQIVTPQTDMSQVVTPQTMTPQTVVPPRSFVWCLLNTDSQQIWGTRCLGTQSAGKFFANKPMCEMETDVNLIQCWENNTLHEIHLNLIFKFTYCRTSNIPEIQ
jgi:hypothetical protein